MSSYQSRFVALDRLPRNLSELDVDMHFRLSKESVDTLQKHFRTDRHPGAEARKLALAAQIVFLRATGRPLDQVSQIPKELLRSLGAALNIVTPTIASLRAIYRNRSRTLHDHQRWAETHLRLDDFSTANREKLIDVLNAQANEAPSLDDLVNAANLWLFDQRILIPAERGLRDLAQRAFSNVEMETIRLLKATVPAAERTACHRAVFSQHGDDKGTVLLWLKTPPKRHSPSTLAETLEKIQFLRGLGVHQWDLQKIPLSRQRGYSQALANRPPSETRKLKDETQLLHIVCFMRITLLELTDSALYQTGRRISDFLRHASEKAHARQARSSGDFRRCLVDIKSLVEEAAGTPTQRLRMPGYVVWDRRTRATSISAARFVLASIGIVRSS